MIAPIRFHGLAVVPAGSEHLAAVIRDLRPGDRHEAEVLEHVVGGGLPVEDRLADGFSRSCPRLAMVRENSGETLALGGIVPFYQEPVCSDGALWGVPWMVGTRALDAAPGAAARAFKKILPAVRRRFAGLINLVLVPNGDTANCRLLARRGFGIFPIMPDRLPPPGDDVRVFFST